ncbi:MAG: cadherin domain-containing protein [Planctomycetaceae bacterium]
MSAPDYETPTDAGTNNVYDVNVQVSDGALIDTQAIAVTVTAVNDNTPVITSNGGGVSAAVNVAENVTAVTTVTATDADLPAQTLTYSISGGPDAAKFRINGSSGVLKFDAAPNFELPTDVGGNHVYNVTVQVSDGNGRIDTQTIEVTVTDLNDTAPVVSPAQAFNVSESAVNGFSLGAVQATDADTFGNLQSWAIVSGNSGGIFAINAATGQLTVRDNTNLDFEFNNSYTLGIRVGDGVNTSATATVVVSVTNVNESPTITAIANKTLLESGDTGQLAFTIGDPETAAGSLTITATSSNQTMIPNANLVIAGTGANRTITAAPPVGQSGGPVTITLTVSDGTFQAQEIFEVTVVPRVITVTTMADENDGDTASILSLLATPGGTGISLREAIIATNNTRIGTTPDQIILPAGTYSLIGSGDDNASTGDLDIRDHVIITGGEARATTISAQGTDRVFHILNNSTATITGLTITGGNAHGGGALVDDGTTLNLTDVAFSGNTSDAGGAVHVHGTLNLNRVTLANNTANSGGALYFHGADGGSLLNVTISGNTATSGEGGAIWTDSAITVTNATFANNTGATVGGIYISGGNVLLKNSILDNNGRNASAALTSGGFNLDSEWTSLLRSASDRVAAPFLN